MSPKGSASPLVSRPLTSQAHGFYWCVRRSPSSSPTSGNSNPSPELQPGAARLRARGCGEGGPSARRAADASRGSSRPRTRSLSCQCRSPGTAWPEAARSQSPCTPAGCLFSEAVPSAFKASPPSLDLLATHPLLSPTVVPRERPVTVYFSGRTLLKPQREEDPPHLGPISRRGEKKKKNQILFWRGFFAVSGRSSSILNKKGGEYPPPRPRTQQPVLKANCWRTDSNAFFPIENRSYCNAFKYMQMIHAVSGLANLDYNINYPSKSAFVLNLSLDYNSN